MLKKAGIVAAATAAGLVAVSPLAFAGDKGHSGHHGSAPKQVNSVSDVTAQKGLINVGDVNALNNLNVCPPVNANVAASILGILGGGNATAGQDGGSAHCAAGDSYELTNND